MAQASSYSAEDISYHTITTFTFSSGTTLHDVKVAYKSINPGSTHGAVLVPTCYGGLVNETLSFTTAPHDGLAKYHVVVAAMLGNGESSSPSNKALFPEAGQLHYEDVVRAHHDLVTVGLGITRLAAVVGFSMGAQLAYYWAVMYPGLVGRVVAICGSARTSPHNHAFLEGPLAALTNSIDYVAWREVRGKMARGEAQGLKPAWREMRPERGLRAFGRVYAAWLTSAAWFRERWWGVRGPSREHEKGNAPKGMGQASLEAWLTGVEDGMVGWDADDLVVLARMWQMGDIGTVIPGQETDVRTSPSGGAGGDDDAMYEKALGGIRAKVLVMPCRTDQYFSADDSEIEVSHLKRGRLAPIDSIWGHAAGAGWNPRDAVWMSENIRRFMEVDDDDVPSLEELSVKD